MCVCSTAKRRRKQAKQGRKAKKFAQRAPLEKRGRKK